MWFRLDMVLSILLMRRFYRARSHGLSHLVGVSHDMLDIRLKKGMIPLVICPTAQGTSGGKSHRTHHVMLQGMSFNHTD